MLLMFANVQQAVAPVVPLVGIVPLATAVQTSVVPVVPSVVPVRPAVVPVLPGGVVVQGIVDSSQIVDPTPGLYFNSDLRVASNNLS